MRRGAVDGADLRAEHLGAREREPDAAQAQERVRLVRDAQVRRDLVAAQVHGAEDHRPARHRLGDAAIGPVLLLFRSGGRRGSGRRTRCGTARCRRRRPPAPAARRPGSSMFARRARCGGRPASPRGCSSIAWSEPCLQPQPLERAAERDSCASSGFTSIVPGEAVHRGAVAGASPRYSAPFTLTTAGMPPAARTIAPCDVRPPTSSTNASTRVAGEHRHSRSGPGRAPRSTAGCFRVGATERRARAGSAARGARTSRMSAAALAQVLVVDAARGARPPSPYTPWNTHAGVATVPVAHAAARRP